MKENHREFDGAERNPKKSIGAIGQIKTTRKVEVAFQRCHPNGPSPKSQVALALGLSRGSLYLKRKQAKKDKQVAIAIEAWHEKDDTMGHRKLGALLHRGKNRVKRVMKKYDITARRKRKKSVYPGKASSIVPNLLREEKKLMSQAEEPMREEAEDVTGLAEIVFSDIFEVQLADHIKVRGCFALWKQTRHILAIAFENHMRADLVVSTLDLIQYAIPGMIFHSDQGSQYGAEQTREALLKKGFIRSMSRVGTPTDNGFAERFVGQFKLSVAERRRYQTLGVVLQVAEDWVNLYNHLRPHEGLDDLSPDQFARKLGLPVSEQIRLMTASNRVAVVSDAAMAATSVPQ